MSYGNPNYQQQPTFPQQAYPPQDPYYGQQQPMNYGQGQGQPQIVYAQQQQPPPKKGGVSLRFAAASFAKKDVNAVLIAASAPKTAAERASTKEIE
ncbi:MAG: hypothetical protein M1820_007491 [Bogoriella megaspora]|nr:MAG: hypothetical protein M1820_007491 [Bogoriella megaspora]